MITRERMKEALDLAVFRGATYLSDDVHAALHRAMEQEDGPAKEGLRRTLQSLELSRQRGIPACPDTGWPLFFIKLGNEAQLEGGVLALQELGREAIREATLRGTLRKTMKHPITGFDPGDNVSEHTPYFTVQYVPGSAVEITYAAKGGGSEVFGGTRHQMLAFADGLDGIRQFVLDAYIASARAGAVCPPGILGIGIGGTANMAADLAKEAACLRAIGSHHPEPIFNDLEQELMQAINSLGIGHMGAGGRTSVLAVHVEYSYTHIAGVAVATSTNCCVARRATVRLTEDAMDILPNANWFGTR